MPPCRFESREINLPDHHRRMRGGGLMELIRRGSEPLDWIVRTDPGPEFGAALEHVVAQEFGTQISDSGASPVDDPSAPLNHPASWSDQQATLDQVGALHDHRAASAEDTTRSAN